GPGHCRWQGSCVDQSGGSLDRRSRRCGSRCRCYRRGGFDGIAANPLFASGGRWPSGRDGSFGDIAIKHEDGTAAYALEGVSEGVKATSAETSTERTVSKARRTDSAPARTKKTAKGRHKSSKK